MSSGNGSPFVSRERRPSAGQWLFQQVESVSYPITQCNFWKQELHLLSCAALTPALPQSAHGLAPLRPLAEARLSRSKTDLVLMPKGMNGFPRFPERPSTSVLTTNWQVVFKTQTVS